MRFRGQTLRALGRKRGHQDGMNKEEKAYGAFLDQQLLCGLIQWWAFERIKLKLADNTFYTVDFLVLGKDGTVYADEVKARWSNGKAGWEDDARVKFKVAADQFPFTFRALHRKTDGSWSMEVLD